MPLSASTTNAITNFIHATFLFIYFIAALIHYLRKDNRFSILFVLFFLTLFVLKLLGVYVHYFHIDAETTVPNAWVAISLLVIMLNYLLIEALTVPNSARILVVFLSILSAYLFLTSVGHGFIYIAFPSIIVYAIAAYYTKGLLRVGFLMVILSNIIWIASREIVSHILGYELPIEYRYDNDIYHLLLTISTFLIYRAISIRSM